MKLAKLWAVVDPRSDSSTLADCCFETDARNLFFWATGQGAADPDRRMVLYTERGEADVDARARLDAYRAYRAVAGLHLGSSA